MNDFFIGRLYSRSEIWKVNNPGKKMPTSGPWFTGYVQTGKRLITFVNLNTSEKLHDDFSNSYDPSTGTIRWHGKPNAHSAQPIFQNLFDGRSQLLIFACWDKSQKYYTYLGKPQIYSYQDNVSINSSINTIELTLHLNIGMNDDEAFVQPEANPDARLKKVEGGRQLVLVNMFERDPSLRAHCIKHFGAVCQICQFDFSYFYGTLGKNYCHVHHLKPLSELDGPSEINPIKDLIPVCPNCHSMLHQRIPALKPEELMDIIEANRDN
jgi:5-methylcytosine-specific restriction protein A